MNGPRVGKELEYGPVARWDDTHPSQRPEVPASVYLRAYEVYVALHGEQEALVTGWCRGGFGARELMAYLYARSFPKEEWRVRTNEASKIRSWQEREAAVERARQP